MIDRPVRVLLVEDDENDFVALRELFSEVPDTYYMVEWAATAQQASERFAARDHDVCLIDWRLGGCAGLELLHEAQLLGVTAPVIMLAHRGEPGVDIAAIRAGAADFLFKGEMTASSLEQTVRHAIESRRAAREIEKLAAFPRCNPNPVIEFTRAGAVSYANEAAMHLARSLGQSSVTAILPEDTAATVSNCLRQRTPCQVQSRIGERTFSWSFVPVPQSDGVHGYATEITERLGLEAQLRHSVKMEAVGQLAAGVAHDFNNILTVIQGHASLLLSRHAGDIATTAPLRQVSEAADRACGLIRQLLLFSRKQVMQPRPLDMADAVRGVSRMLERVMGEDIAVEVLCPRELPWVHGDPGMIEQVLMNLAVNSRDAMPRGGKFVLSATAQRFDSDRPTDHPEARTGEFVCLSVSDTGCGMDPVTLGRIFEPFFTTKEVGRGSGLGLATVYGIVKQHRGWIEVESEVGLGTSFRVFLPAEPRPAPAPRLTDDAPAAGGAETILVVEDEDALRELVTEILTTFGYRVVSAPSGVQALKVWEKHRDEIDLLLTDMVMPEGMSGRELAERLLRQEPELQVIYTSGYSPGMAGKDLALIGGFNFLPKPYPPVRLVEMVRECLDHRGQDLVPA
jgi:signal transduction histidine kinase